METTLKPEEVFFKLFEVEGHQMLFEKDETDYKPSEAPFWISPVCHVNDYRAEQINKYASHEGREEIWQIIDIEFAKVNLNNLLKIIQNQ